MPTSLSVTAVSQPTPAYNTPSPVAPIITLNGTNLTPSNVNFVGYSSGFQLVLMDPNKSPGDASAILWNQFHFVGQGNPGWLRTMWDMYESMTRAVYAASNPFNVFVIAASFGLDNGMVPSNSFLQLLFSAGASTYVQKWLNSAVYGYPSFNWVDNPANYIAVGSVGQAYGGATAETWAKSSVSGVFSSTVTATLP